jgi:hypothetical protein
MIGLSVHVLYVDIDSSVGATGIKPSEEEVATVTVTLSRVWVGGSLNRRQVNWSIGLISSGACTANGVIALDARSTSGTP